MPPCAQPELRRLPAGRRRFDTCSIPSRRWRCWRPARSSRSLPTNRVQAKAAAVSQTSSSYSPTIWAWKVWVAMAGRVTPRRGWIGWRPRGMRFSHAYAQPLCTNTRVQLMTGKYNNRNWLYFGILDPRLKTIGQYLRDAGYQTCIAGKWQLQSYDPARLPRRPTAARYRDEGRGRRLQPVQPLAHRPHGGEGVALRQSDNQRQREDSGKVGREIRPQFVGRVHQRLREGGREARPAVLRLLPDGAAALADGPHAQLEGMVLARAPRRRGHAFTSRTWSSTWTRASAASSTTSTR